MRSRFAIPAVVVVLGLLVPPAAAQTYDATVWNGSRTPRASHPAVAVLQRPDTTTRADCSATVVHPRWVLTAAHCVFDIPAGPVVIGVDGVDVSQPFGETFRSRMHVVHPRWNPRNVRYDFALIRLPEPSTVPPVALAAPSDTWSREPGLPAQIVGWGAFNGYDRGGGRLRQALITTVADHSCEAEHGNFHRASMVCGDGTEADACRGDSGGPLLSTGEQAVQLGVISFGNDCDVSVVGVYAWVPAAREWIDEVIAGRRVPAFATESGILASRNRVRPGRGVTLRAGVFRRSDGYPLIRQRVEVLRRPRGTSTWRVAARRRTNLWGLVRFRDEPRRDMEYALRHRGSRATKPSRSPIVAVRVIR